MEEIRAGTVTELRQQKHNKERLSVYLDGEFAFGISAIVGSALSRGQRLEAEDVERLLAKDQYESAKQRAFHYLSLRPRSVVEIRRYLRRKSFGEQVVERTIERLRELDMLDDLAFAKYWIEQRETFKPRGRMALGYELRQKGIDRAVIDLVLSDVDEEDAARRAAAKRVRRWRHHDRATFFTKLSQYLQRRGFHYGTIKPVVQELWEQSRANDHGN